MITSATTTIAVVPAPCRTRARQKSESGRGVGGDSLLLRIGNCEGGGSIVAGRVPAWGLASPAGGAAPAAAGAPAAACAVQAAIIATMTGRNRRRRISAHLVIVGNLPVPIPGFLDGPLLVVFKIHIGQPKAFAIARGPFKIGRAHV